MVSKRMAVVCVIAVLAFLAPELRADGQITHWQGAAFFQLGFPTGEYKDQIDKTGFGIGGDILFAPQNSIFGIGVSGGWFQVGREDRSEPFSTTIPDVTVDVSTSNNLLQLMALLRLQPKSGPIQPYGDGVLGLHYLYTRTTISNASNGEEVASSTNQDDAAFAYGFGGGIMIKVFDGKTEEDSKPLQITIDLNCRYILGGEAEYLKEGSIRRTGGLVVYDLAYSRTDIVTARVGVAVNF